MTETQIPPATADDGDSAYVLPRAREASLPQHSRSVKQRAQRHARTARNMQFADARPRSFLETWDRHRRVAGAHHAPILNGSRLAWGVIHLATFKWVCMFVEWITESPLIGAPALLAIAFLTLHLLHVI